MVIFHSYVKLPEGMEEMLRFYDQKYGDMKWWVVIFKMGYEWRYLSAIVSAPWSKHGIWFMVVHLISGYIIFVSINGWLEDGGPRFHVGFLVKSMEENKWAWLKTGASVHRCVTPSKQIRLNPWMRNFGISLIQLGFTSRAKKTTNIWQCVKTLYPWWTSK